MKKFIECILLIICTWAAMQINTKQKSRLLYSSCLTPPTDSIHIDFTQEVLQLLVNNDIFAYARIRNFEYDGLDSSNFQFHAGQAPTFGDDSLVCVAWKQRHDHMAIYLYNQRGETTTLFCRALPYKDSSSYLQAWATTAHQLEKGFWAVAAMPHDTGSYMYCANLIEEADNSFRLSRSESMRIPFRYLEYYSVPLASPCGYQTQHINARIRTPQAPEAAPIPPLELLACSDWTTFQVIMQNNTPAARHFLQIYLQMRRIARQYCRINL